MEIEIRRQALLLLLAFAIGTGAGLLYDLLRPPRWLFGRAAAYLLDALYCLAVGAGLFAYAMAAGEGRLGQWELAAALLGFLCYLHLFSPVLLPPLGKAADGVGRGVGWLGKRAKKFGKNIKKFFQKIKGCYIMRRGKQS